MKQYLDLIQKILDEGIPSDDRTGTGTLSLFGEKLEFDLKKGFPLLTTKALSFKNISTELLWFLSGNESTRYLDEMNNTIWKEWCKDGFLHEGYGKQWRNFSNGEVICGVPTKVDQIATVIEQIKTNPNSRRLIVSAWNPFTVDKATLPPCHILFQFYVRNGELSCCLYQRSCDIFLGVPYNIASYSILTHLIAHLTGLQVGKFVWFGADVHLYQNHVEAAKTQLERNPNLYPLPEFKIYGEFESIDDFRWGDFGLEGYEAYPNIKAKVAV